MSTENTIRDFVINEVMMGDSSTKLDNDQSLIDAGILDSLALLRLISFVEEQFGFVVDDGEVVAENFQSVNVTAEFVRSKLNGAA